MEKMTVADLIIQQLIQQGIKRVYAVAGDTILFFFDRLANYPEIQLITARHEGAAAFMASAEAKLTGQLTLCMAHNGPGTANLINGLGDAYTDRCPVLALTGQVERCHIGTDYKQYIPQQSLTNGVSCYSELITHPDSALDLLNKAMRKSITMGSVTHLVIPKDIFPALTTSKPREREPYLKTGPMSDPHTIGQALQILNQAKQPVFLVGRGAIMVREQIKELAEKKGAAIITTLPGRGSLPDHHPQNLGGLGHAGSEAASKALKETDLVVILGASWWPYDYVPSKVPILQIDANPNNLGSVMEIKYGVVGKLEQIIPLFLDQASFQPNPHWLERLAELKSEWEERLVRERESASGSEERGLTPQQVMYALEQEIPTNAIIVLDVGDHVVWFSRNFHTQKQQILISGRWRSMGFGLPAAAAAGLVFPDQPIVLITGDGGLSMVLGELSTLIRYQIPVKICVINNEALAMEMNRMIVSQLSTTGTDLTNPGYAELAESYGIDGYKVVDLATLKRALKKSFHSSEPTLIDIATSSPIPPHTKL